MLQPDVLSDTKLKAAGDSEQMGGKARNLVHIQQQLPIPSFYVVTPNAFRKAIRAQHPAGYADRLLRRFTEGENEGTGEAAAELREMIRGLEWPNQITESIQLIHAERFGQRATVAVRSSAVEEDALRHSFAGIYESVLNVKGADDVLEAVKQVWASYFSDRAQSYRRRHRLIPSETGIAVIVQQMIDARQSGVMFTCDPTSGHPGEIIVEAVRGCGHELVQGSVNADSYRLSRSAAEDSVEAASQSSNGQSAEDPAERTLSQAQVARVAKAGIALERLFGCHQDVEFCFDGPGKLFILQSRPVTELRSAAGNHMVWDNSNIIESYGGVTTPLTFSFIRRAYAIVYKCFAEVMGISPVVVRAHRHTFENMLGFFRGRVYYNLKNWYRLVRLFPGYEYNSQFMESMMGLKEPLLVEADGRRVRAVRRWFVELPALVLLVARISWKFFRIKPIVQRFERHFDAHYEQWRTIRFDELEAHELSALYRQMETSLLWNWKAPIINDFYVMVFYGILKTLCTQWCGDRSGSLQNGLLCGSGDLASAEPAKRLLELARVASEDSRLREMIMREPSVLLMDRVAADPRFQQFHSLLKRYLDEYGLRCEDELKLESFSHRDRPERVFETIRDYLKRDDAEALDDSRHATREQSSRQQAEDVAFAAIAASSSWVPRRWVFRSVLNGARRGIRQRESMRFARTKIYGIARAMFRSLGQRLAEGGSLDDAEDIFYLTTDEVWDFVQGTAVSTDLRGVSAARRREYDDYRSNNTAAPDSRFETTGIACIGNDFQRPAEANVTNDQRTMTGTGCCPGVVEGPVQIIHDASHTGGFSGDILVAARTDPGWVPLFPAFRGMLIERGSVLSHSAIVAREMGIPTIVGVSGLLDRLQTGQRVRLDGAKGLIEILSSTDTSSPPSELATNPAVLK